ncbi:MAG: leucyl aminopeptidase [Actinomycetota bacterium]|nr:leucyl aminopeptidase [Actinomycetota bacterium]
MIPEISSSNEDATSIDCDALVVGAFSENGTSSLDDAGRAIDSSSNGEIAKHLANLGFRAKPGEVIVVPTFGRSPARAVAIVGLGPRSSVDTSLIRRGAGAAIRRLGDSVEVASALGTGVPGGPAAAAEGFFLGAYEFATYKKAGRKHKTRKVVLLGSDAAEAKRASIRADATAFARDLINEPPSELSPRVLAERTAERAQAAGVAFSALDETQLADQGFGGILGVSRGSAEPPRLIRLHHAREGAKRKIVLVGKGVTFDSGGLSLKDPKSMETMKTDMGGAAAVIAAVIAAAELDLDVDVVGLTPATENMPGSRAIKPGDVIKHYSGQTTEVVNTDSEGRLILADVLAHASESRPDAIVDAATLTGSIQVALGKKAAGVFATDDGLADGLIDAGESAGERLWRMPLYEDYLSELDSEVADHKNSGSRWGGAIIAAMFLKTFVGDGIPWAHLDIAGAARADADREEISRGGTGFVTRTLIEWLGSQAS